MNIRVLSIIGMSLLLSCNKQQQNPQNQIPKIQVQELVSQSATSYKDYPATLKGREDVEIHPRIDGNIEAIYVEEGSFVNKGQVLFKINSPSAEQAVRTARAAVNSAKTQVDNAEMNVKKTQPLVEKKIVSAFQLESLEYTLKTTQAQLAQAQAQLTNAEATLSWTRVVSPVSGRIGIINYRLGSLVGNAQVLTTVANTSEIHAYYSINEKEFLDFLANTPGETQDEKIKNASEVQLVLSNDSIYSHSGELAIISGLIDPVTGSVSFRANFPNEEGLLRSGSSGKVRQIVKYDDVIVIPQKATIELQNMITIFLVTEGEVPDPEHKDKTKKATIVKQIPVKAIPLPDGINYVVTSGLKAGDKIAVEGVLKLRDGMPIEPSVK